MSREKLIKQQNSLEFSYGEIIRIAIREQLKAKLDGNATRLKALVAAEEKIQERRREARRMAMVASLTDDRIDQLVTDLDKHVESARDLLAKLRRAEKILENIRKAAELAVKIVGTVAKIL